MIYNQFWQRVKYLPALYYRLSFGAINVACDVDEGHLTSATYMDKQTLIPQTITTYAERFSCHVFLNIRQRIKCFMKTKYGKKFVIRKKRGTFVKWKHKNRD